MSWWNATIPLWQVIAILTVYSAYREIVKILVKLAYKKGVRHVQDRKARRVRSEPIDGNGELPAPRSAFCISVGFVHQRTPTYSWYRPRED